MRFATKKAFTMMELVVIWFLLSVGFWSIITMLNSWVRFTQIIRTKIVALNLAREWVEAMFQIRDTNRRRWSSKRDLCRLKIDSLVDDGGDGCEVGDKWFGSGNYIIFWTGIWDQKYFIVQMITGSQMKLFDGIGTWDLEYSLCFWSGQRYTCPWVEYTWSEGKFFRQIIGKWLFLKDSNVGWTYLDCADGSDQGWVCGDSTAKEYRFCSRVEYDNGKWVSNVEICSLMTNFLE